MFIELTGYAEGEPFLVNINEILSVHKHPGANKHPENNSTIVNILNDTHFLARESYEEIRAKIMRVIKEALD